MIAQDTQEWLQLRKNYLGASDAPIVKCVSPWKTPYQLWLEKLGLAKDTPQTKAMQYGKEMEEPARRAYELYTGYFVTPEVIFHPEKKFMMASLDGLNRDKEIAVEIKNANKKDHELARSGKIPEKYYPQLQHQLACLKFNVLHYYSYNKGEGILVEVARDDNYIDHLYKDEETFWDKVQNLEAPNLIDRDYIECDNEEFAHLAKNWKRVNSELSELQKKEKEYREALIAQTQGNNIYGFGLKLTKSVRKGSVDYKKIPEISDVNLDLYRKDPVVCWRITA